MSIRTTIQPVLLVLTISGMLTGSLSAQDPSSRLRIGVFDSRMVALAYYNSAAQQQVMRQMHQEYQKAKAENNQQRVKELEKSGPARQELMHRQVFSTGCISNVLAEIKGKLPEIARQNQVDLLVSRWDLAYYSPSLETRDVTLALAELFEPGEKARKWMEEMKGKDPIAIDRLPSRMDD